MSASVPRPHAPVAPRTTGEVITDALDALRRSFKVVFTLGVPFCAVDLVLREFSQSLLARVAARAGEAGADLGALVASLSTALAAMGAGLGSFVVQQLLTAGVVAVGVQLASGRTPSVGAALRMIADRGAAVVLTALLFLFLVAGLPSMLALVAVGASAGLAWAVELPGLIIVGTGIGLLLALVAFIVTTLRWALYSVVVVTEGRSFWSALRRSSELTAPRGLTFAETPRFRLSVLFLIGLALAGVIQSIFIVPRVVIALLTGWSLAQGALPGLAALPVWFMVPFGLVEVVTNAAVVPFSAFLLVFFTLDLRVRYEGADVDGADGATATATAS